MENWRAYTDETIEEACQGSQCLAEYKVSDFLNDIGTHTGLVQKTSQAIQKVVKEYPDDNKVQLVGKRLLRYLGDKGLGALVGAGVGASLGAVAGPGGMAALGAAGAAIGQVTTDAIKSSLGLANTTLEKMFLSSQGDDPPADARSWILDLNDQVESLMKGGSKDSPLYRGFRAKLVKEFDTVEQNLRSALEGATEQNRQRILQLPMSTFIRQTASQMSQDYINNTDLTKDVGVDHPGIT
jgi:hypothetical protein|tara:strand:- start:283 stop:1002 length:720 start_codon:yes stop_codon:yes gene_type:complete